MAKGESYRQGKGYRKPRPKLGPTQSPRDHLKAYWVKRLKEYRAKAEEYPQFAGLVALAENKLKALEERN